MKAKLPPTAVEFYAGLGTGRSYQAVANHFGVTKRAVVYRATCEHWQNQVAAFEAQAKHKAQEKAMETLSEMNDRHLRSVRVIQAKALEALRSLPISTAMEAVRALDLAIKHERVARGLPTERTATDVAVTKSPDDLTVFLAELPLEDLRSLERISSTFGDDSEHRLAVRQRATRDPGVGAA